MPVRSGSTYIIVLNTYNMIIFYYKSKLNSLDQKHLNKEHNRSN
jgi:hypothetical protein